MEVGPALCGRVELGQHIDNAGFHVLPFLCEDVGKLLDEVLAPSIGSDLIGACSRQIEKRGS